MKLRRPRSLWTFVVCVAAAAASAQLRPNKNWRDVEPETVTLLSRAKYKDTSVVGDGKAGFSFRYGVRGEVGSEITLRRELLYGSINLNGDSDWFIVTGDRSRIKDLGELRWPEVLAVPYLPASARPHEGIRGPTRKETFEQSSDGQVSGVMAGHMYIVHAKDSYDELYALFRVERLVPGDEVTISWKLVPSPKR